MELAERLRRLEGARQEARGLFPDLLVHEREALAQALIWDLERAFQELEVSLSQGTLSPQDWERAWRARKDRLFWAYALFNRYPQRYDPRQERSAWHAFAVERLSKETGLPQEQVRSLLDRYGYAHMIDAFIDARAQFGLYPGAEISSWAELRAQGLVPSPEVGKNLFAQDLVNFLAEAGVAQELAVLARGEVPASFYTRGLLTAYLASALSLVQAELPTPAADKVFAEHVKNVESYARWLEAEIEKIKTDPEKVRIFMSNQGLPALFNLHNELMAKLGQVRMLEDHGVVVSRETLDLLQAHLFESALREVLSDWELWELGRPWWTRTPALAMPFAAIFHAPSLVYNLGRVYHLLDALKERAPYLWRLVGGEVEFGTLAQAKLFSWVKELRGVQPVSVLHWPFTTTYHAEGPAGYHAVWVALRYPSKILGILGSSLGALVSLGFLVWSVATARELWDLVVRTGVAAEIAESIEAFLESAQGKVYPSIGGFQAEAQKALARAIAEGRRKLTSATHLPGGLGLPTGRLPPLITLAEGNLRISETVVASTLSTASWWLQGRAEEVAKILAEEGLPQEAAQALAAQASAEALAELEDYLRAHLGRFTSTAEYWAFVQELLRREDSVLSLTHLSARARDLARSSRFRLFWSTPDTKEALSATLAALFYTDKSGRRVQGVTENTFREFLESDPYYRSVLERAVALAQELVTPRARALAYFYGKPERAQGLVEVAQRMVDLKITSFLLQPGLRLSGEPSWRLELLRWLEREILPPLVEELSR